MFSRIIYHLLIITTIESNWEVFWVRFGYDWPSIINVKNITVIPDIIPIVTICEVLPFSTQFALAEGNNSSKEIKIIIPATKARVASINSDEVNPKVISTSTLSKAPRGSVIPDRKDSLNAFFLSLEDA